MVLMDRQKRWTIVCFALALLTIIVASLHVRPHQATTHDIIISSYPWQPDNLTIATEEAALVVEGTIKEVLAPQWTTPDGKAPDDPMTVTSNLDVQLRTPIMMSVEHVYKGDPATSEVLFSVIGGVDGQFNIQADDTNERPLVPGTQILIFLGSAPKDAGPWAKISPFYPQLYYIVDEQRLQGPITTVEKDAVMQQLMKQAP